MKFHPIMFCSHSLSINNWSNVCTVTQKFWTLFQCIGTKIFGPCSSAQGRKFLDPVPVHKDENFWILFHATSWNGARSQLSLLSLLSFHEYVHSHPNINFDDPSVHSTFNIDWSIGFRSRMDGAIHLRRPSTIEGLELPRQSTMESQQYRLTIKE